MDKKAIAQELVKIAKSLTSNDVERIKKILNKKLENFSDDLNADKFVNLQSWLNDIEKYTKELIKEYTNG